MLLFFEMIHMQKGNFASMDQPQESTQGHVGGSHTVASMDRKKPSPSSTISLNSDAVDRLLAKDPQAVICTTKQRAFYLQRPHYFKGVSPWHKFTLYTNLSQVLSCGANVEPLVIDIGADAYWVKMFGTKRTHCKSTQLLLVDPNPYRVQQLRNSSSELRPHFLETHIEQVAIANYSGLAAFYFNQKPGLSGAGSLTEGKLAAKRFPDHPSTMTEVATLDSLVDRVKPNATIPFLKVAARGWELEALHGAIRSLQRTHMVWFAHSHHWRSSLNAAVEFLQTLGFVTFLISHDGLVRLNAPYWDPIYDSISGEQQVLALQASSPLLQKRRLGIFCVNPLPKTPGM
uniref:Methyltransferase FkbM domain-containing protein n=1 Tax=Eutreptiella gymnastica TaxID=73025 RepID=A0A7S4FGZ3_9EUGL